MTGSDCESLNACVRPVRRLGCTVNTKRAVAAAVVAVEEPADAEVLAGGVLGEHCGFLPLEAVQLPSGGGKIRDALWPASFKTKTRDEWTAVFDGTDACVTPVLSPWEAHLHPHNEARSTFVEVAGAVQPAPAPRFSRTPSSVSRPPSPAGADTVSGLLEWGVDADTISKLRSSGALS